MGIDAWFAIIYYVVVVVVVVISRSNVSNVMWILIHHYPFLASSWKIGSANWKSTVQENQAMYWGLCIYWFWSFVILNDPVPVQRCMCGCVCGRVHLRVYRSNLNAGRTRILVDLRKKKGTRWRGGAGRVLKHKTTSSVYRCPTYTHRVC